MSKGGFVQNNFKPFRIGESGPTTFIFNTGESNMKKEKIVLGDNTVIKAALLTKPITGDIIAIRDGKPIRQ